MKILKLNHGLGRTASVLNLILMFGTFAIVVFRYCFGMSWVSLQEFILYCHGSVFMLASGWTYSKGQHVRVDVFYGIFSKPQQKGLDTFGVLFFLFPFCIAIFYFSFPYVVNSWKSLEGSGDANGLPGVFILKSLLLVFPITLMYQGLVQLYELWLAPEGGSPK